ncbi:hypothetical protein Acr_28g0008240 [Actinidia rufa]|uniref:HXXXD-type acyl-transferase family protein n=1 Tax=Actinidia rufa TaxID=165716 RepID=A0A7J0HAM3_9ERIC|nr:hypothetical protein Acr_28g0008240 [Actinidia rufa]
MSPITATILFMLPILVAAARTETRLSQLGELMVPKPEFKQFVGFLHEENEEQMNIKDMPLLFVQLTQLGCGAVAFASRYNHCVLDGVAVHEFVANMASLTRGEELVIAPNPDRTLFKARIPPIITHPHHEYSKPTIKNSFCTINLVSPYDQTHLIYLSPSCIADIKKVATRDGKLRGCTTFQAVAARIWKARSAAVEMGDEKVSTMFFPVDCRKRVVPPAPKVQEGLERLDDEYVRSSIDWLEVNKGLPWREDSFSLVSWWRLGVEEDEYIWGKTICTTPVALKPGLVYLLPGRKEEGGLHICLELPDDQIQEFRRLMMEG